MFNLYRTGEELNEITPNLYLGGIAATANTFLDKHKITHVLTVTDDPVTIDEEKFKWKKIVLPDYSMSDLLSHFDSVVDWIEEAHTSGGTVLVHCTAGMSRSATLTIAFIMKTRKLSFHDAYKFVKSKRRVAFPNTGFRAQLVIYERLNYNLEGDSDFHSTVLKYKNNGEFDTFAMLDALKPQLGDLFKHSL